MSNRSSATQGAVGLTDKKSPPESGEPEKRLPGQKGKRGPPAKTGEGIKQRGHGTNRGALPTQGRAPTGKGEGANIATGDLKKTEWKRKDTQKGRQTNDGEDGTNKKTDPGAKYLITLVPKYLTFLTKRQYYANI